VRRWVFAAAVTVVVALAAAVGLASGLLPVRAAVPAARALAGAQPRPVAPPSWDRASASARGAACAAEAQVGVTMRYDAAYVPLRYPGGDVPKETGVCTDVVIRALRTRGVDLQVQVHEDMARHFDAYPHKWDLTKPDAKLQKTIIRYPVRKK
jgi:uncharacterized protein YijF (DUF1287 family)